jgi:hypothetical protein
MQVHLPPEKLDQPPTVKLLDVALFRPMKRRQREVLTSWKEECVRHGWNYATIPQHCFPSLLRELLEKNFGP